MCDRSRASLANRFGWNGEQLKIQLRGDGIEFVGKAADHRGVDPVLLHEFELPFKAGVQTHKY